MQKVGILLYLLAGITLALDNPCVKIINTLAPQPPALAYRINAYLQAQKDITGKSTYTAPTHAGIRLEIPLIDKRETWELKKEYLRALQRAKDLLSEYLSLRQQVEEEGKYYSWQWQRVVAGIEYKKEIWKNYIQHLQKISQLKAVESTLRASGISKKTLDACYRMVVTPNR